jgi:hypothetical protein
MLESKYLLDQALTTWSGENHTNHANFQRGFINQHLSEFQLRYSLQNFLK